MGARGRGAAGLALLAALAACQRDAVDGARPDATAPAPDAPAGPHGGASLPACAEHEPVLTELPVPLGDLRVVSPLGHLAPPPHTFPSDHVYLGLPSDRPVPLVSPGNVTITGLSSTEYPTTPPTTDYAVTFRPCREVELYFGHVKALAPSLLAKLGGGFDPQFCQSYMTGGHTVRACNQSVAITVAAGEALGTAGADFGAKDGRVPALAYVNPANNPASPDGVDTLHVVCPLDYFRDDLKAALRARIGTLYGPAPDAVDPWCGAVMQDVAQTAAGRWFAAGARLPGPDDPNLALVRDYDWATPREVFSVGTSVSASGLTTGVYFFHATAAGDVNRRFRDVAADGAIYCYEGFSGVVRSGGDEEALQPSPTILLQLTSPTTLRIERRTDANCAALGVRAFSAAATELHR